MDELDNRIVSALVRNGRASYAALGSDVGLSPHAIAGRVRRLEERGVITGYTALVDAEQLGHRLDAMIDVTLRPETQPERFEAEAARIPAVREIAFVTGRSDYQLRVACRDPEELDQAVRTLRQRGGAATTETRIVMRSQATRGAPASRPRS